MRIAEKKKSQITALYEQCSNLPVDVRSCLENGYFTQGLQAEEKREHDSTDI